MNKYITVGILVLISNKLTSQEYHEIWGIEEYKIAAEKNYNNEQYPSAIEQYSKALRFDSANIEILLRLGKSHLKLDEAENAYHYFTLAELTADSLPGEFYYDFAETLLQLGKNDSSLKYFNKYESMNAFDRGVRNRIEGIKTIHTFFWDSAAHEVNVIGINSTASEIGPSFFKGDIVYLSSRIEKKGPFRTIDKRTGQGYYKLQSINMQGGDVPRGLKKSLKTYHQGPIVFFNDFYEAYSTQNITRQKGSKHRLTIVHLKWDDRDHTDAPIKTPLPFDVGNFSIGHPATNADGSVIIFASDMPFGYGGTDLYYSEFVDGVWTNPTNLGEEINTSGDEVFPFLSDRGQLYFASDGHPGLGGLDIFKVNLDKKSPIVNLGAPINSSRNDFSLIFDEDNSEGYFASNRVTGQGREDIYHFKTFRQTVEVKMLDSHTGDHISGEYEVVNKRHNEYIPFIQSPEGISFKGLLNNKYQVVASLDSFNEIVEQVDISGDNTINNLELIVDTTKFAKPAKISIKVEIEDYQLDEMETVLFESNGRGLVPFDVTEQGIVFDGLTHTNYVFIANHQSHYSPIVRKFSTDGGIHNEINLLNQNELGVEVGDSRSIGTEDSFLHRSVVLTFNSGGFEENYAIQNDRWQAIDKNASSTEFKDRIRIGPFYFDVDCSELRDEVKRELEALFKITSVAKRPKLLIKGYADTRGSENYNKILSAKRALAVQSYLVSLGYDGDQILIRGMGESELKGVDDIKSDLSKENYQMNRRVTISFAEFRGSQKLTLVEKKSTVSQESNLNREK